VDTLRGLAFGVCQRAWRKGNRSGAATVRPSGAPGPGAWGCFDEFNRLKEDQLSAVSDMIQVIQAALKQGDPTVRPRPAPGYLRGFFDRILRFFSPPKIPGFFLSFSH